MMKKLGLSLIVTFIFIGVFMQVAFASNIAPYYNNIILTDTTFNINENGKAGVSVYYDGYPGATTGATICIKIEKRNLLVFWKEVVNDVYYFREESHAETFVYQLEKTGTYRCTVDYLISGTGGTDDEITFQDTKTYG